MVSLDELVDGLRSLVGALDASVLEPAEADRLMRSFTQAKRIATAGEALCAKRVADSGRWRASGARSEADWLAKETGETVGAARTALETVGQLDGLDATDEAFRTGKLSAPQAAAVASAAHADPAAEDLLLQAAGRMPVRKLQDEAGRIRNAGADADERHRRVHKSRYWRKWVDHDGGHCGQYKLTAEAAAVLEAAAAPFVAAAFRAARERGEHEPSEAYAADGLVAMAAAARAGEAAPKGGVGSRWPRGETVLLVDLAAVRRGNVEAGELCEIAGVGPVPVSVAQELFGESLLKIVIRDGVDIRTVVHTGRKPTAAMLTALLARDGGRCVRPHCDRPVAEVDHTVDWADCRVTRLDDLAGLCRRCHDDKTRRGHTYRWTPSGWEWRRPDGATEVEVPP